MQNNTIAQDIDSQYDSLIPPPLPHTRRGFLVTALGAGFALATQPIMAQTAIVTPADGLTAGEFKVPVADGEMVAYRAQPAGGRNLPVVLVVSEIFGVHEYIRDTCRRLAKLGYLAIAPELFARQGDPRSLKEVKDILEQIVAKVPDAQVMADLDACVAWAGRNGGDTKRLAITGFCWGGRITWLYAAHNPGVKAAVAWYGRIVGNASALTPKHPIDLVNDFKAPVLGLYGGVDTGIPLEVAEQMQDALKQSANPVARASMIEIYDNAPHAFHADYRPSYRKEEAEDGWQKMRDWFKRHGV
jgi:carboxymethylenebutenolidase